MGRFTELEVAFLQEHLLGRLATTGKSEMPHVVPVRYQLDPDTQVIKIGARTLEERGQDRLYVRHLKVNPQAAFVVDDVADERTWRPRGMLIKGSVVLHQEDGEVLGPNFGPNWVEIAPSWSTSWGVNDPEA
jgi:pyridoxamine 5'-phosphate oxidase family protein